VVRVVLQPSIKGKIMQIFGFITTTITGLSGAGSISAPGMKVGDRIIQAVGAGLNGNVNIFEAIVTVDDQIQQFEGFGNATAVQFDILAVRI
jgi:hypothetical protein